MWFSYHGYFTRDLVTMVTSHVIQLPWLLQMWFSYHGYFTCDSVTMVTSHVIQLPWLLHTWFSYHGYFTCDSVTMVTSHVIQIPWVLYTWFSHHGYFTCDSVTMVTSHVIQSPWLILARPIMGRLYQLSSRWSTLWPFFRRISYSSVNDRHQLPCIDILTAKNDWFLMCFINRPNPCYWRKEIK